MSRNALFSSLALAIIVLTVPMVASSDDHKTPSPGILGISVSMKSAIQLSELQSFYEKASLITKARLTPQAHVGHAMALLDQEIDPQAAKIVQAAENDIEKQYCLNTSPKRIFWTVDSIQSFTVTKSSKQMDGLTEVTALRIFLKGKKADHGGTIVTGVEASVASLSLSINELEEFFSKEKDLLEEIKNRVAKEAKQGLAPDQLENFEKQYHQIANPILEKLEIALRSCGVKEDLSIASVKTLNGSTIFTFKPVGGATQTIDIKLKGIYDDKKLVSFLFDVFLTSRPRTH